MIDEGLIQGGGAPVRSPLARFFDPDRPVQPGPRALPAPAPRGSGLGLLEIDLRQAARTLRPDPMPAFGILRLARQQGLLPPEPAADAGPRSTGAAYTENAASPWADAAKESSEPQMVQDLSVPAYRKEVFKNQMDGWRGFGRAVDALDNSMAAERRAYREIFAAEGGTRVDPVGEASSGITYGMLNDHRDRGRLNWLPWVLDDNFVEPKNFTLEERALIYRDYFDEVLKNINQHRTLEDIGDEEVAATFADTLFRHGGAGGANIIRQAVRRVLGEGGRAPAGGLLGQDGFEAFTKLAKGGTKLKRALLDALKAERDIAKPGESDRHEHFRFVGSAEE